MKATIDTSGSIRLPLDLQNSLGLKAGDEVIFEQHGTTWLIRPANGQSGLCREGAILVHKGVMTSGVCVEDAIQADRDDRFRELSQGLGE